MQYFYLIVSPRGEQMIVTFSIVPQQVQRFSGRDVELVRELAFPEDQCRHLFAQEASRRSRCAI